MALSQKFQEEMTEAFKDVKPEPAAQPPSPPTPQAAEKPAAAPSPAPAAASDPDDEIVSGKRSPKSEDFKRVKSKAAEFATKFETAEQERARLAKELEAAKAKPSVDPAEVESLRKELAASKEQFSTVALEFMPEFNQKYQQRVDKVKESLKQTVPDKVDEAFEILAMSNSRAKTERLSELMLELDEPTKYELMAANREISQIQSERTGELKASQDKLNAIVEGRKAAAKQQQEQAEALFNQAWDGLSKENPLYQPREGDEAWNGSIKERQAIAKALYSGQVDPQQRARLAAAAASHNLLVSTVQAKDSRIAELEKQLQSLQATNPGVRGGGTGARPESKGFAADFEEAMRG